MADDVDSFLEHYGVKGMKWGVRKTEGSNGSTQKSRYQELRNGPLETLSVKTKHGQTVEISEIRKAAVTSFVYSISKKGTENYKNFKMFDFKVGGKKVGNASFNWDKPDELNLVWLGINSKEQGKGYGSAVFDAAVKYGQAKGAKRLTLEVPGTAPNARHIYEKQGFVVGKQITSSGDVWGGLTEMSLDLTKAKSLSHASISREEAEMDEALKETFPPMPPELEAELYHADVDSFLEHFGVKGMKWGVRKADDSSSRSTARAAKNAEKADRKWNKQHSSNKFRIAMYNDVADQINAKLGSLNAKYEGKDISDWSKGDGAKYVKEFQAMALSAAENSRKKLLPDSPSGKYTTRVEYDPLQETFPRVYLVDKTIEHADEPSFSEMEIIAVWKNKRIVSIKIPDMSETKHSANLDDHLEHFGVKGMKWGVRKASPPVVAGRTVVKKKPMAEKASNLSDAELKKRIERLRMEEQYNKLTSPNLQNGMKVAKFLLGSAGSVLAGRVAGAAFDYATGYNGGASAYRTAIVVKDVLNARKAIGMG